MSKKHEGFAIGKRVRPLDQCSALNWQHGCYEEAVIVNMKPYLQLMSPDGKMFFNFSAKHGNYELVNPDVKEYLPDAVVARMQREGMKVPLDCIEPQWLPEWLFHIVISYGDVKLDSTGTVRARDYETAQFKVESVFPQGKIVALDKK